MPHALTSPYLTFITSGAGMLHLPCYKKSNIKQNIGTIVHRMPNQLIN